MEHDFKKYPELTNSQMEIFYFDSPHEQITEDFWGKVVKVHDGDTITISCDFRNFTFSIRFSNIMAKELSEGGHAGRDFLENLILGENVEILINKKNRVGKYGRLLGKVIYKGFDVGEEMIQNNFAVGAWQEQLGIKELILLNKIK